MPRENNVDGVRRSRDRSLKLTIDKSEPCLGPLASSPLVTA